LLEVSLPYDENGGNIENHEREGGDRQDGRRLTFVPRKSRKILCISRIKVIRKNWGNEAYNSNNSKN
jgi:hypothetical protein